MEVKINTDSGERTIAFGKIKSKHIKKIWKYLEEMSKNNVVAINNYLDYLDATIIELTGMKQEELDDLETAEKEKLNEVLVDKAVYALHFTKLSLKPAN